jgi:hypothetical protein
VQVVVDNSPPTVKIIHPEQEQVYVKEDDEWVSITADAQDTWEMDRVEFYLDGKKLGESVVAPYSLRWTITMSDVVPVVSPPITGTRVITYPDGTIGLEEYLVSETKLEKYTRPDGTEGERLVMISDSGFGALYEAGVLTETHKIVVKAFDRAGNQAESEPVRILVMHKPKEKTVSFGFPSLPVVVRRPDDPTG